ncbi:glycine zipper 2TM domain-containing protein [Arenimonas fontis]|uniref:Glycine zipper 2TM domain-containing protein n=1 Tax=Arenimonas fontis TaxID=2608255 RepID=A0A5B2Z9D4_9GAMM|nr:glycine zipper 2TM domain-containing protein [Arenimonas fontis]KAA2284537.1 glycine zipper 2TM domain-containing protein [Arenimonas fontis]
MRSIRLLPPLLAFVAAPALAQYQEGYGQPAYDPASVVPENVTYGYAQVLRADEVYETVITRTPEERCDEVEYRQSGKATAGAVVGAIVGAAVGNQIGKGDGRKVATVAGAAAGGAIGHNVGKQQEIADARAGACRMVEVERQERQLIGYDVEYMYKGEKYMSRLPYDPGNRLRVRVSVTPDAVAGY